MCLHGYRTSGVILQKPILEKWPQFLLDQLDLVFMDGPYPAQGKAAVEGIFEPPFYEWFQADEEYKEFYNFEECLAKVEEFMLNHGPFDGVLGFSQLLIVQKLLKLLFIMSLLTLSVDKFIRKYASEASFGIRLSCQKRLKYGYVKQKYIVFNGEWCPKDVWLNTLDPKKNDRQVRSSNFRVCGCKARVVFDMVVDTTKYLFIIKAANANIGAVRAHNLYTNLKGSSSLVHGTQTEFKNFTRGVNCFIGDSDAQMLITRMEQRQDFTKTFLLTISLRMPSFVVYFRLMKLRSAITRSLVISYKMVFVPFTAINNHMKYVTVVSGLLKKETMESYGWLLIAFKKAFVRPPNIVVTDQDRAMRLAVAAEFPESKHRLCMWHIMQKIPTKIVSRIYDDTDFKDKFVVSKMYCLRSSWVLAFFVDSPLCGLMRTTSRQRHTQEKLDRQSFDSFSALLTPLPIEEHAAKVYTHSLFIRVQKEIEKIKHVGLPEVIEKESTSENVEEKINLHQKVIGHYKEQKNSYDEKNEAIEKLAMEASIILDSCVHMLRNNEPKLSVFVNKMKAIKSELETELPIVLTCTVSDFVQEFMGVKKPDKEVKNPTGVRPNGSKKQKRVKSGREITMKKRNRKLNGCGVCGSTSHNRRTCPQKNDVDVLYPALVIPSGSDHVDGGL
nr:hypothetical protein [Tanacetum cinerariifolium]